MPISLSAGHVITANFSVNPDSLYSIDIELDKRSPRRANCEPYSVLSTRWVLSSDGVAEQGSSPWENTGLTLADLYSGKTRYAFDVEILPGASCLNASNPRLKVQTHPYPSDLYVALTWLSIVPVGIGIALLTYSHVGGRSSEVERMRMFPDMVLRHILPITKHVPLRPIHDLPHWPLSFVVVLFALIFIFILEYPRRADNGLLVTLKNREAVVWETNPWPDTLEVYVRAPARFFVNGQEVSRDELHAKLTEQLVRRPEWTVYFEADPDITYMEAVYAIDTIQACGGKLVWITPKMRENWQQRFRESKPNRPELGPLLRVVPE